MNPSQYSPEQVKDIQDRETQGLAALKALNLTPAAILTKVNLGGDIFADKVQPFLQDILYTQKPDENPSTPQEPVEAR